MLNQESHKFVTINTHKGLYQYTRIPFGIASTPALFWCTMETILQGIPNTNCYLDDILVTGNSAKIHLKSLTEVLQVGVGDIETFVSRYIEKKYCDITIYITIFFVFP